MSTECHPRDKELPSGEMPAIDRAIALDILNRDHLCKRCPECHTWFFEALEGERLFHHQAKRREALLSLHKTYQRVGNAFVHAQVTGRSRRNKRNEGD